MREQKKMDPELLNKYLDNTASDEQIKQVVEWLESDPSNQRELERMDMVFAASVIYGSDLLRAAETKPRAGVVDMRRIGRYIAEIAAVIAVAFGLSYMMTENRLNQWLDRTTTLEVPVGHYVSMKLQDGTTVWLNSGTRFEYPSVFAGSTRRVKVDGEALFEVAHDASRPFIVETFACDVEVLGTKFNVLAEQAEGLFSTALLRGSVKVTSRLIPNEQFLLKPNQEVFLVDQSLNIGVIADHDEYLWVQGIISIKGLSFTELMRKFEKSFGVEIVLKRGSVPTINYNYGKIRVSDGVDSALKLLQQTVDFTYERSGDNSVIIIR